MKDQHPGLGDAHTCIHTAYWAIIEGGVIRILVRSHNFE